MVIAPLLGPNIALSLASTLGDLHLAKRSLKAVGVGVATAAVLSVLLGVALRVDPSAPQLAARTQAGLGDIALALAAGAAGSLAFTSGVSAVVVGVMVAVALLPPLVVAGLLAGAGHGGARPSCADTLLDQRHLYQSRRSGDIPPAEGETENVVGGGAGEEGHANRRGDVDHHARGACSPDVAGACASGLTSRDRHHKTTMRTTASNSYTTTWVTVTMSLRISVKQGPP